MLNIKKVNQIIQTKNSKAIYENDKIITADEFSHDIKNNILNASGNVQFLDQTNNVKIFTENAKYKKVNQIIQTKNSKAIYENDKIITADEFTHDIKNNILNSSGNVKVQDKSKKNNNIFRKKLHIIKL